MVVEIFSFDGHLRFENIIDSAKACYLCALNGIEIEEVKVVQIEGIFEIKIPKIHLLNFCRIWILQRDFAL